MLLGTLHRYSNSRSSDTSSMVVERISSFKDDESASYAAPDDATVDILSSV